MNPNLNIPRQQLQAFCGRHRVRELAVFGSALRDDFSARSDVDLLVDFAADARIGLVAFHAMREELAGLFGRPVDLVTRAGLNRHIRDEVVASAEVVHAE